MKIWHYENLAVWKFGSKKIWHDEYLAEWKFGRMKYWQNENLPRWKLAEWKFGSMKIWQNENLAEWKFGSKKIWQYENLAEWKFCRMKIWQYENYYFKNLAVWKFNFIDKNSNSIYNFEILFWLFKNWIFKSERLCLNPATIAWLTVCLSLRFLDMTHTHNEPQFKLPGDKEGSVWKLQWKEPVFCRHFEIVTLLRLFFAFSLQFNYFTSSPIGLKTVFVA